MPKGPAIHDRKWEEEAAAQNACEQLPVLWAV